MKTKPKNNQTITSLLTAIIIAVTLIGCGNDFNLTEQPDVVNNAPVITSAPIFGAASGVEYSYTLTATDADTDDVLTVSATTIPAWLVFDSETGVLSGTPADEDEGDNAITLSVSDGSDQTNQTFTLTVVILPNEAPVVTSTAYRSAVVDVAYSYTVTATDNEDDALTFSAVTLPAWLVFDAETGALTGTPSIDEIGVHAVSIVVSDGKEDTSEDFNISVTETAVTSFVIFDDAERADWPAWDCCGGSFPSVVTDDEGHGAVVEFTIGANPTVMG